MIEKNLKQSIKAFKINSRL